MGEVWERDQALSTHKIEVVSSCSITEGSLKSTCKYVPRVNVGPVGDSLAEFPDVPVSHRLGVSQPGCKHLKKKIHR